MTGDEARTVTLLIFLARKLNDTDFKIASHLIAAEWFGGGDGGGEEVPAPDQAAGEGDGVAQLKLVA